MILRNLFFLICATLFAHASFALTLTSTTFTNGKDIPTKFTCDGQNISPPLAWQNAPKATKSFALTLKDPDAPNGTWIHWVLFNIPSNITALPENIQTLPETTQVGQNSWQRINYDGPCPPNGMHHYIFTLYALDSVLKLNQGASDAQLQSAISNHVLGSAELMGVYTRK